MTYYRATVVLVLVFVTTLSAYNVELIASSPKSVVGEGPHWDRKSQSLYYVDIDGTQYTVLRYSPSEDRIYGATIDGEPVVSFIIPVAGTSDEFAVGIVHRVGVIRWDGKSSKAKLIRIASEIEQCPEYQNNRLNDGKGDPYGRLFAGTMRKEECDNLEIPTYGNLFRFAAGQPAVTLNDPECIRISNGLAWNKKINKFYYIDSCAYDIKEFDYDPYTGAITNKHIFINFTENGQPPNYLPDGMTIDTDGNLYVCTFGGSQVLKVNPRTGTIEMRIKLPAAQVTSATFGGELLDDLYVTTAAQEKTGPQSMEAGHLFRVRGLGVRGLAGMKVRV